MLSVLTEPLRVLIPHSFLTADPASFYSFPSQTLSLAMAQLSSSHVNHPQADYKCPLFIKH